MRCLCLRCNRARVSGAAPVHGGFSAGRPAGGRRPWCRGRTPQVAVGLALLVLASSVSTVTTPRAAGAACLVEQSGRCVVTYPDNIQDLINDAFDALDDPPPLPATGGLVGEIQDTVEDEVDDLPPDSQAVALLLQTVEREVDELYPLIQEMLATVIELADDTRPVIDRLIAQLLQEILPTLIDRALQAIEDAGPVVDSTRELANDLVAALADRLAELIADAGPTVDDALADASRALSAALQSGRDLAAEAQGRADDLADQAQGAVDGVVDGTVPGIIDSAQETVNEGQTTATSVVQNVNGTVQDGVNDANEAVDSATDTVQDGMDDATDAVDETTETVQDGMNGLPGTIEAAGPVPGAPYVFASTVGATAARVWWEPAADAVAAHNAVIRAVRVSDGAVVAQQVGFPSSESLFQNLQAGAQYRFDAAARNSAGTGPVGQSNVITAGAVAPSAPTNVLAWPKNAAALVEWDPPASFATGISAYSFHAIDTVGRRPHWRSVLGRHTSIVEPLPPLVPTVDPVAIEVMTASAPAGPQFRFCVRAATAGGYGPETCTANALSAPVGPQEPTPCAVALIDDSGGKGWADQDDDGLAPPPSLADRLQLSEVGGAIEARLGARFAGMWGDFTVTPDVMCISAVGISAADITAIRAIAVGPRDRLAFHAARYSQGQLLGFQETLAVALDRSGEREYSLSLREDLGLILVARHVPTIAGTAALASSTVPPDSYLGVAPDPSDRQRPKTHDDPFQNRSQFPPYRAGLRISNFACALAFTMKAPLLGFLYGSTAGHCFAINNPIGGVVEVNGQEIGREGENRYSDSQSGRDFALVELHPADPPPRAQVIVAENPDGTPIFRNVVRLLGSTYRKGTSLCVSAARTRECGKVVVSNRTFDAAGHRHRNLTCILVHTADGDSGAPVYERRSPQGYLEANAAGWAVTGGERTTCFVRVPTIQQEFGVAPHTVSSAAQPVFK